MRSISFQRVLYAIARYSGLDPASGDLSPELALAYTDFINERLREGREHAWWPELLNCEARAVDGSDDHLIPLAESGLDTIEHVKSVTSASPFKTTDYKEYPFRVNSSGIHLLDTYTLPTSLYVTYRAHWTRFDSTAWSNTENNVIGDVRYLEATGECYECIADVVGETPSGSDSWQQLSFPYLLLNWVKYAAASDALRENGQHEKAERMLKRADDELYRLEDVEITQQQQPEMAAAAVG